ncbi:MAG: NAD(+)/NADH kinase [bacterium]|nr:NAD(+)/NADH kinase [bacterium]
MSKLAIERKAITLYVDTNRETARALAAEIAASFRAHGYAIATWKGQHEVAHLATDGVRAEESALFVTVGGDGTLLRAARVATELDAPLLGINTGRLGFLTELDHGDPRIASLPALVDAGLLVEERIALEAEYGGRTYFALNDVVVRKGDVSRIVPFSLSLDSEHIADIPADGICIATPTGSTAYFLSAGGSIISPRVDAFGIVPLLPHTLFSRPLIVPAGSRIEIGCDSEVAHAHLECDGDVLAEIGPNSTVSVRRHPKRVRFARVSKLRFFERLEQKMRWGVSIKAAGR